MTASADLLLLDPLWKLFGCTNILIPLSLEAGLYWLCKPADSAKTVYKDCWKNAGDVGCRTALSSSCPLCLAYMLLSLSPDCTAPKHTSGFSMSCVLSQNLMRAEWRATPICSLLFLSLHLLIFLLSLISLLLLLPQYLAFASPTACTSSSPIAYLQQCSWCHRTFLRLSPAILSASPYPIVLSPLLITSVLQKTQIIQKKRSQYLMSKKKRVSTLKQKQKSFALEAKCAGLHWGGVCLFGDSDGHVVILNSNCDNA